MHYVLQAHCILSPHIWHSPTQRTQLPLPSTKARALGLSTQQPLPSTATPTSSPGPPEQLALALHDTS